MNVFSNRVKHQFAHDITQLAVLAAISSDQNKVSLGFKQWPDRIDVAVEYVHARVSQNQGVKCVLFRGLELFLIDEIPVFFGCFHHVHRQILLSHRAQPFHLDEQVHGYEFCGKC